MSEVGRMRTRITIRNAADRVEVATVWASIEDNRATIRKRSDILSGMIATHEDKDFLILSTKDTNEAFMRLKLNLLGDTPNTPTIDPEVDVSEETIASLLRLSDIAEREARTGRVQLWIHAATPLLRSLSRSNTELEEENTRLRTALEEAQNDVAHERAKNKALPPTQGEG